MCRAHFCETIFYPRGGQRGDSWNSSGRQRWGMNSTLLCFDYNSNGHESTGTAAVDSGIYIVLWSSRLGTTITSMTQYVHHVMIKSPRQRRCQHDSAVLSSA
jgi:hypothetical protein